MLVRFEEPVAIGYKLRLELMGNGAWLSTTEWPLFNGGDWHQFHTGVGEKTLIGLMESIDSEATFPDRKFRFPRKRKHDVTGNPVQDAAFQRWCEDRSTLDPEEVAHGAFCQLILPVQQDTVECACGNGFSFCEDVVQEVRRLDVGGKRAWEVSSGLGDDHAHALLVLLP